MKVYIAGKISGIEDIAAELFKKAEDEVIELGYIPSNPMTLTHKHDKTWQSYMKECVAELTTCDAIYLLSNYSDSRGAKAELDIAHHLELDVIHQHKNMPKN